MMETAPIARPPRYPTFAEWIAMMVPMLQGQGWPEDDARAAAAEFATATAGHLAKFAASPKPTVN